MSGDEDLADGRTYDRLFDAVATLPRHRDRDRILGYIAAGVFDSFSKEIDEGETYREGERRYDWTSRAGNYFAGADELWLSFRDD